MRKVFSHKNHLTLNILGKFNLNVMISYLTVTKIA